MVTASARLLVGRTIVAVELRTFEDGEGLQRGTHHRPVFVLDNGARVTFYVTETDSGTEYGVTPQYHPAPRSTTMTRKIKHGDLAEHRSSNGRYRDAAPCDGCGKPTNEATRMTDEEACGGSDGPGFYLCDRAACVAKLEAMTKEQRFAHYGAQRAKNNAKRRQRALVKCEACTEIATCGGISYLEHTCGKPMIKAPRGAGDALTGGRP